VLSSDRGYAVAARKPLFACGGAEPRSIVFWLFDIKTSNTKEQKTGRSTLPQADLLFRVPPRKSGYGQREILSALVVHG
jgi:hypothetical protein